MLDTKEFLDNDGVEMNIFYNIQSKIWNKENEKFWGMSTNSSGFGTYSSLLINENLRRNADDFWNNGSCKLKEHLLSDDSRFHGKELLLKNTWYMDYNDINNYIRLSAYFLIPKNNKGVTKAKAKTLVKEINSLPDKEYKEFINNKDHLYKNKKYKITREVIAYMPLVTSLGFRIKNSDYSLRTQIVKNNFILKKRNGVVQQKDWVYYETCEDTNGNVVQGEFEDGINHFKDVHENNYPFLNAILGEQVTEENFTKALDKMPEYDPNSAMYFTYRWFSEIERAILSSPKSINIESYKPINYIGELNTPKKYSTSDLRDLVTNLIIVKSKLKALEVTRSVLFVPAMTYASAFCFSDTEYLFDAFKTTTNRLAGRTRVLLDNIFIEDNMLKLKYDGKVYNQFDIILGNLPKELKERDYPNLSCLSKARYNYLNDAKRIMFCSKLRSQAVGVTGQLDDLTHEIPARVIFADWKGFSFGDSFIISESFAKQLDREVKQVIDAEKDFLHSLDIGDPVEEKTLVELTQKNMFSSYRNIRVTNIFQSQFEIHADAPFGIGDKISNMHGSKGIVSIILPDDEMPILQNDLSENMKAGPVDVIIPGASCFKRKSSGQLFEAITRALGIKEMSLQKLYKNYKKEIEEYDKKSIFKFDGKTFQAPCGINNFIRLDHDASSKQIFSYIKSNTKFGLRHGEMENLNLAARGYYNILNELDIRALNKHTNSYNKVKLMQEKNICKNDTSKLTYLQMYMKALGWNVKINDALEKEEIDTRWTELFNLVSNKEIDLFQDTQE